jgi:hypothetical protein
MPQGKMLDATLNTVLGKFLKGADAIKEFLALHPGKTQNELIELAMAAAQTRTLVKRRQKVLAERTEVNDLRRRVTEQDWDELLIAARALVLCGLPYRKSEDRQIVKKARLGNGQWLTVVYSALGEHPIPFGKDRAILSWITTVASRTGTPLVKFDTAMDFMRAFGMSDAGSNYRMIRASIDRLKAFSCYVTVNDGSVEASSQEAVIKRALIPSRDDADRERGGEVRLPIIQEGFFVELDPSFYQEIRAHGIPIPLDVMKRYANNPMAWDFIMFLNYRVKIARTPSRIPLEQLAQMLGTGDSNLRKVKMRLEEVLKELREIWPDCPARFEGSGSKANLYVAPPKDGHSLVQGRAEANTVDGTLTVRELPSLEAPRDPLQRPASTTVNLGTEQPEPGPCLEAKSLGRPKAPRKKRAPSAKALVG